MTSRLVTPRRVAAALAGLACGSSLVFAADARAEDAPYIAEFERRLDAAYATGEFVGLAVAVVKDGDLAALRVYGETVTGSDEPVTPNTVFRLASVSKGFASTLVAQLAADGRLSWSDPVVDHAPRFRLKSASATQEVTLAHLASHTAGVTAYAYDNFLEDGASVDRILDMTARTDMVCRVGACYQYQNTVYSLLGDAVEHASGATFEEAMDEQVFEPLGMFNASVGLEPLLDNDNWARPHSRAGRNGGWRAFEPNDSYYRVAPAGGLNASIDDMVQWVRAQLGHEPEVVSDAVLDELHEPVIDTPRERRKLRWMRDRLRDADYALGWRVYDYAGERLVLHAGGVAGYRAMVALAPDEDLGVAILWNSSSGRGWRIMPTLMDAYFDLPDKDWLRVDTLLASMEEDEPRTYGSGSP